MTHATTFHMHSFLVICGWMIWPSSCHKACGLQPSPTCISLHLALCVHNLRSPHPPCDLCPPTRQLLAALVASAPTHLSTHEARGGMPSPSKILSGTGVGLPCASTPRTFGTRSLGAQRLGMQAVYSVPEALSTFRPF